MAPFIPVDPNLLELEIKLHARVSQKQLLVSVKNDDKLMDSKIISSIKPKIGKVFIYPDLEKLKRDILLKARSDIIDISLTEANRDQLDLESKIKLEKTKIMSNDPNVISEDELNAEIFKKISPKLNVLNKRMNKKLTFFKPTSTTNYNIEYQHKISSKRKNMRTKTKEQRRKKRQNYSRNRKMQRKINLREKVDKIIQNNLVINLSSVDISDIAYLYLAKGMNFVEPRKIDISNLKFDTQEFLRKMEWKAFFRANPELKSDESFKNDIHKNLYVSSKNHAGYSHPLLETVKTKLMGWVANHTPSTPKSNLSKQEIRGKKLILDLINDKKIFITKADKGGATLILDYDTVLRCIQDELNQPDKYEKCQLESETATKKVTQEVRKCVLKMEEAGNISSKDKTMITGLNKNNKMKHAAEYRVLPPKIWPLFKIHKLSPEQIENKQTPPQRFINAAKFGPMYRLGQWSSVYLTKISRSYCTDEYLLDTADLLNQIKLINEENSRNSMPRNKFLLFTLDVEALYPSINPEKALEAMQHAFTTDNTTSKEIKVALLEFTNFSFNEHFVTFQNNVYKPKIGIPTGGCDSRQIADLFLHWLIFVKLKDKLKLWKYIMTFKRFIDDVFGTWHGTERQFHLFVDNLNCEAAKFGIKFGSWSIGKSVDFLDVKLTIDDSCNIQYRLFKKATDARNFLRTDSFHSPHVFSSVPYSQMLRVINRNSQVDTLREDIAELKSDLVKSGYRINDLESLEVKAMECDTNITPTEEDESESVVFSVDYFQDIKELKKVVKECEEDLKLLLGNTRVIFAIRKGQSIGNRVVRNSAICEVPVVNTSIHQQKCGMALCKSCNHMMEGGSLININGLDLKVPMKYDCSTNNCIYLGQCKICRNRNQLSDTTYFGQTFQAFHNRMNGHRDKFNEFDFEKSALATHAFKEHGDQFNLQIYDLAVIKECRPRDLDREEFKYIDSFRTKIIGLNKIQVKR